MVNLPAESGRPFRLRFTLESRQEQDLGVYINGELIHQQHLTPGENSFETIPVIMADNDWPFALTEIELVQTESFVPTELNMGTDPRRLSCYYSDISVVYQ